MPAARPRITPRATRALRASSCAAFSIHNGSARFPDGLSGQKSPLPQLLRQGCSLFERNEVLPVIRSLPHAGVARAVGGREAQRMLAVAAEEFVVEVVGVGALHAVFFQNGHAAVDEAADGTVSYRLHGEQNSTTVSKEDFLALLKEDIRTKKINPAALK